MRFTSFTACYGAHLTHMLDDDHYIANAQNAHIDTSQFERVLYDEVGRRNDLNDEEVVELIYEKVSSMIAVSPPEPSDETLICRYLTPTKFLNFLDTRRIAFPVATDFSDRWECSVPEDYDKAVWTILDKLKRSTTVWADYVRSQAAGWNISCWTELHDYFDDHLMWDAYAGGREGIGITIRYGQLKNYLVRAVKDLDISGHLHSGRVNYQRGYPLRWPNIIMYEWAGMIRIRVEG